MPSKLPSPNRCMNSALRSQDTPIRGGGRCRLRIIDDDFCSDVPITCEKDDLGRSDYTHRVDSRQ
jgi:hypothetical protein